LQWVIESSSSTRSSGPSRTPHPPDGAPRRHSGRADRVEVADAGGRGVAYDGGACEALDAGGRERRYSHIAKNEV
jgi:hypothetical protein